MLKIDNVTMRFRGVVAVNEFSIEIKKGIVLSLEGRRVFTNLTVEKILS